MHSSYELFNVKFEDTDYYDYGRSGKDIEQIKASKPDLIIGLTFHANIYNALSTIAPTVLVDFGNGLDMYENIATWIGKEKVFNKEMKKYKKRITKIQKKFTTPPAEQTVVSIAYPDISKNTITVYHNFGAINVVAYDLGFKPTLFVETNLSNKMRESYSPEIFNELAQADYFLTTVSATYNQTTEDLYNALDDLTPGWKESMKAYQNNQFIVLEGELSLPPAFKCYNHVLDTFEKYAR